MLVNNGRFLPWLSTPLKESPNKNKTKVGGSYHLANGSYITSWHKPPNSTVRIITQQKQTQQFPLTVAALPSRMAISRLSHFQPSQGFGFDGNLGAHHRRLISGFRRRGENLAGGFGWFWYQWARGKITQVVRNKGRIINRVFFTTTLLLHFYAPKKA